jgi:hypothetical protein
MPEEARVPIIPCRRAGHWSLNRSGDALSIELIEPDTNTTVVRIVWPDAPTITTPAPLQRGGQHNHAVAR